MNEYFYSVVQNSFYPATLKPDYEQAGSWPDDAVIVPSGIFDEFSGTPPEGKIRSAGKDGLPCWVDIPAPTKEEQIKVAEFKKQTLIDASNTYINMQQWPSKLALGRLKDEDKFKFNVWLDYHDALNSIEISKAPDIEWPKKPN